MRNEFTVIINEVAIYNKIDSIVWQLIKYTNVLSVLENNVAGYIYEVFQNYNLNQPQILEQQLLDIINKRLQIITNNRAKLYELLNQSQVAQRSPEWYELRKNRLTASAVAQALGKGKFSSKADLLKSKAFPELDKPFDSYASPPLRHGIILEDMTARCYSQRLNNITIHNFGMIPHPTINCFGASPDGINELGIMVEIKTPYRRRVDGNIPYEYMVQMQGQMAVCNISECDFVDAEIYFNYKCIEDYINDIEVTNNIHDHGVIVEYFDETNSRQYMYSPPYLTSQQCITWATYIRTTKNTQCLILPWKLNKIIIKRVYFNEEVWAELIPQITDFWNEVITIRNAGISALPVKKNKFVRKTPNAEPIKTQNTVQFIDSDED